MSASTVPRSAADHACATATSMAPRVARKPDEPCDDMRNGLCPNDLRLTSRTPSSGPPISPWQRLRHST